MTNTGPSRQNQASGGSPGSFGVLLPVGAWIRNPALRSWPVWLFVALVAVPAAALVIEGTNPTGNSVENAARVFAGYFAIAWLLLIGVIVRPAQVTRQLLVLVVVIALVTQVPIALAIEKAHPTNFSSLSSTILTAGLPEELAKAIPVVVIALMLRSRLSPVDYLFLGAVSGLVFGASEAQHYITTGFNGQVNAPGIAVAVLILQFVWRFLTDPITHACWAGITGYFFGLAVSGRYRWYQVGWIGLVLAMILHGLNDWDSVNGHWAWVVLVAISAILFVGYAKGGQSVAVPGPAAVTAAAAPATAQTGPLTVPVRTQPSPAGAPAAAGGAWYEQAPGAAPSQAPVTAPQPVPAAAEPAAAGAGARGGGWWQSLAATPVATAAPGQPASPRSKPWWEE